VSSRYIERGPHTNKLSRKNSGGPIGNFLVIKIFNPKKQKTEKEQKQKSKTTATT